MTLLPHDSLLTLERTRTGLATAGLALLLAWETLAPAFAALAGKARWRHAGRNLALGVINALIVGVCFAGLWQLAAAQAQRGHFGILNWVDWPWSWLGRLMVAFLLFDGWMYCWHRLNHRVPWLWRFHRTHHTDPNMDVTTASRFHGGEIILSSLLRIPVIWLLGLRVEELLLYETAMLAVVQLHHANVALPARLDAGLRWVIVTPQLHKVHHSRIAAETDSNYGSLFSWWDRLGGSFCRRADWRNIRFGLEGFDASEWQTLPGLLKTPLVEEAEVTKAK